jgi:hypothetical protein
MKQPDESLALQGRWGHPHTVIEVSRFLKPTHPELHGEEIQDCIPRHLLHRQEQVHIHLVPPAFIKEASPADDPQHYQHFTFTLQQNINYRFYHYNPYPY